MRAPTSDEINSLPEHVRLWIHDLETRCDPAGELRELVYRRDQVKQLASRVDQLEAVFFRDVVIEDLGGVTDKVRITDGNGNELRGVSAVRYEADANRRPGWTSLVLELCPVIVATRLRVRGFTAVVDVEALRRVFAEIAGETIRDGLPPPAPENANGGTDRHAAEP